MLRTTSCLTIVLICGLTLSSAFAQAPKPASATANTDETRSALGDAFRTMFNPSAVPKVRTMGSIQRTNFLDELLNSRRRLEVALVIDATESMGQQLDGVRQQMTTLLGDLRRIVGKQLAVQIILYRDVGAASGPISWPLPVAKEAWATEDQDILTGLSKLVPESGAPYFYEQVDSGLFAALNELNWSKEPDVTRWIFLIGDAPPYQPGFNEASNSAARTYDTELLKSLAKEKDVRIYGIICPSRSEDLAIHQQVLPECKQFFDDITLSTGGWVLNLADQSELRRIQKSADEATRNFVDFAPITQADLDRFKVAKKPIDKVIVAVVPFLDIKSMDFNTQNPMTRLAEEVRSQLDAKGIQTRSLSKVRDAFLEIQRSRVPIDDAALPQKMADKLKADYLIWRQQPGNNPAFQIAVVNARTGKFDMVSDPIDPKGVADSPGPLNVKLCSMVMQSLASKTKGSTQPIAKVFTEGKFQTRLVSTSEVGTRAVEEARLSLQNALRTAANQGDEKDLTAARDALLRVEKEMGEDAYWNNLLANALYGLGQQNKLNNNLAAADFFKQAKRYAEVAAKSNTAEFVADHMFFQKRFVSAIQTYESIVSTSLSPDTICRAHWMLVFLYAGDWGVEPEQVNLEKARQHAIALMATYPESKETEALKQALHWSDSQQRTLLAALPIEQASPSDKGAQ